MSEPKKIEEAARGEGTTEPKRVSTIEALTAIDKLRVAICAIAASSNLPTDSFVIEEHLKTLAQLAAERHCSRAPADNTGLPCPYCEEKLPRMRVERQEDEEIVVQISAKVSTKELKGLLSLLKGFAS